jgi:hypothetical protein
MWDPGDLWVVGMAWVWVAVLVLDTEWEWVAVLVLGTVWVLHLSTLELDMESPLVWLSVSGRQLVVVEM